MKQITTVQLEDSVNVLSNQRRSHLHLTKTRRNINLSLWVWLPAVSQSTKSYTQSAPCAMEHTEL